MKILFLHLSDLHIEKKEDINKFQISKIIDSIRIINKFKVLIIILSGDITYSGQKQQYDYAKEFLGTLINKLKNNIKKVRYYIFLVPGNHDIDYSKGDLGHKHIVELYKNNKIDEYIDSECEKLNEFIKFAKFNNCFVGINKLYFRKIIKIGNFNIEVNLLNSAIFSSLEEDKGLHYLPERIIEKISNPSNSMFVISVIHHSFHWFSSKCKNKLEEILLSKSSLLFLGHEHILTNQNISYDKYQCTEVLNGGVLCNRGNWKRSEYNICTYDINTENYELFNYKWNTKNKYYEHKKKKSIQLNIKPSKDKLFLPDKDFENEFFRDSKENITKNFFEYFVFPRLELDKQTEKDNDKEIIDEKTFFEILYKEKKLVISGYENSGKTLFLKYIFKVLKEEKTIIFCDAHDIVIDINSSKFDRVLKNSFENIYGNDLNDYKKFQQLSSDKKVLLIDGINIFSNNDFFNKFINEVNDYFDILVFTTNNILELDIKERARIFVRTRDIFTRYKIMPFFSDKRYELIKKIVKLKLNDSNETQNEIIDILEKSLKRTHISLNLSPSFIIEYTSYYCINIKNIKINDGTVFSKVFEANIVNAVTPHIKRMNTDKLFIVIDKIAYYIHKKKKYPLRQENLTEIINGYNEKYGGDRVNFADFIKTTLDSKILEQCSNNIYYKFSNKNHLAFFIAREIKRKYFEDDDISDLNDIINYSCFGINSDILLFLTYITDNIKMLRLILTLTEKYTNSWIEYSIDSRNIPYLTNISPLEIRIPSSKQKKQAKKLEIEHEKQSQEKFYEAETIYQYKEEDVCQWMNQLSRAISLLNIISKCLPSFEHMMLKKDTEMFIEMIYKLPNKIFYYWAIEVEKSKHKVIEYIKELKDNDYDREGKPSDEDILGMLQWDSISLYLDILNMVAVNSTKENTESYFRLYNLNNNMNYKIQLLSIFEQRDKVHDFIIQALNVYKSAKDTTTKIMLKRIIKHLLLFSKNITYKEVQKIESKFFDGSGLYKKVLLERNRRNFDV